MSSSVPDGTAPSSVMDAVLKPSDEMPEGSQKVEELDFNKFAGRSITVEDLVGGMSNMGFQASSIGEAVRIINDMVGRIHNLSSRDSFSCCPYLVHLKSYAPFSLTSTNIPSA
jgi:deoxyhypusine synthase